jgi:hypothetical protein
MNDHSNATVNRRELFATYLKESNERIRSNSQNYDKAIFTLSSSSLIVSLTLINKLTIFPSQRFTLVFLGFSWVLFCLAIICTLVSFLLGNKAINESIKNAEDYYIREKENALNKKSKFSKYVCTCNWGAFYTYILAIIFSIIFVFGVIEMKTAINDGLSQTYMTKVTNLSNVKKGLDQAYMPQTEAREEAKSGDNQATSPSNSTSDKTETTEA